jgi:hypothetical protein
VRKQLETSRVHAGHDRDRLAGIDRDQERRREDHAEIDLAMRDPLRIRNAATGLHVVDIGEAFGTQQLLGDILRGNADAGTPTDADRSRLRWSFVSKRCVAAKRGCGTRCGQAGEEITAILPDLHQSLLCSVGAVRARLWLTPSIRA